MLGYDYEAGRTRYNGLSICVSLCERSFTIAADAIQAIPSSIILAVPLATASRKPFLQPYPEDCGQNWDSYRSLAKPSIGNQFNTIYPLKYPPRVIGFLPPLACEDTFSQLSFALVSKIQPSSKNRGHSHDKTLAMPPTQ